MIKNNRQLQQAKRRLQEINNQISEYRERFSGIERDLYVTPLVVEAEQLTDDISEYSMLVEMDLEDAVERLLNKPILIDNISQLLSKLRIAAKLSQKELADILGWKQSNLSRFENENYSSQTLEKIVEYVTALGVLLYITPSLTEKVPEITYRKEVMPVQGSDTASTSSQFAIDENQVESDAHIQFRGSKLKPFKVSISSEQEFISV